VRRPDRPTLFGIVLLSLYTLQAAIGVDWGPLTTLQTQQAFRKWSGAALTLLIAAQWVHPMLRLTRPTRRSALSTWHRWLGSGVVVAFFVHTTHPGPGYLALLHYTLWTSLAAGMAQTVSPAGQRASLVLLTVHILASVLLLALLSFHIWVVFAYSPRV